MPYHLSTRIALLCSLLPGSIAAQVPDTTRLEALVVTATRDETDVRLLPAAVSVVSGEELRVRGFRFVSDWLATLPGMSVVPTGSYGGVTSMFIRGGESDYAKVLLDGVAVNLPGGAVDLANLGVEHVERVEVVRGPASVVYGSDAVTGVVQILTRRGHGTPAVSGYARAGTYGSSDFRLGTAGASADDVASWSLAGSWFGSGGAYDFNNRYRSAGVQGRGRWRADQATDFAVSLRYADHLAHFPTDFAGVPSDSNQFNTERTLTIGLDAGRRIGQTLEVRLAATALAARQGFEDDPDGPGDMTGFAFASTRDSRLTRYVGDVRVRWIDGGPVDLTAGVEASTEREDQESMAVSDFGDGPFTETGSFDERRGNAAAYAQAIVRAVRVVDVHAGLRHDQNEAFGGFTTWRAGVVWFLVEGIRIRGAAGTAFKQPTFSQQYADTPFEVGDPALRPERSASWEIGVSGELADGALTGSVTWFDQDFRDMVEYVTAEPGSPTYANLGRASASGLETEVRWAPAPGAWVSAQWTWTRTRAEEAGSAGVSFTPGAPLLRRPTHAGSVDGGWQAAGGPRLAAELRWSGARDDVDFRTFPAARVALPAWLTVGLSADIPLRGGLALTGRLDNLLDAEFETVVGYPALGRRVLVGVRYR